MQACSYIIYLVHHNLNIVILAGTLCYQLTVLCHSTVIIPTMPCHCRRNCVLILDM